MVGVVFNMIEELFNPGRRHTDEEKKRLELSRTDVGDGDPGRGPIDLDSGTVLIRPAASRPPDADGEADAQAGGGGAPDAGEVAAPDGGDAP
ncbi:hypothetical protein BX286_5121 [Streptomyces sp. 3211.6]|uniref:DUF6191 domain-containing protein n=1 Tax=Streptomyces TaxID=1883 RepID=UPI0009A4962F|nr:MULTISPECIES: DUF6191 domain-containing protein [Streptomyces]RKT07071.1 hypothetical protein BX286_5121 [Streptomyces sp. 3211.6]RPF45322.1 hypothetical protein EDD96_1879 [Streptomyces sp. Ag109_G2-6]